jgi:hypothetical protein
MTVTPHVTPISADIATALRNDRIATHPGLHGLPPRWKNHLTNQVTKACKHFMLPQTTNAIIDQQIADFRATHLPNNLDLTASDSELGDIAQRQAARAALLLGATKDSQTQQIIISQICASAHLPEPQGESITSRVKRLSCSQWWRRQLRRQDARTLEDGNIRLGYVQAKRAPYASRDALMLSLHQEQRNRLWMESTRLQNETGDIFTLQELADKSTSNKAIRRSELMTRIRGMEDYAEQQGHLALFVTITCPSAYHATLRASGQANPTYQGHTPRQAQDYLCKLWSRIRAKLKRDGIECYGLRVAEPHHDGCPHWHLIMFMQANQRDALQTIIREHALADSPNETGAAQNRCHFVPITAEKGSATGYVAKYIAKNIDGYKLETDLTGEPAITASLHVTAWAKTHGIRQFQAFGAGSVSVWRELRRIKQDAIADAPAHIQAAWHAAQKTSNAEGDTEQRADYATYLAALGGAAIPRKDARIQLVKLHDDTPGRYGEALGERPIGIADAANPIKIYESTRYTWTKVDNSASRVPVGKRAVKVDAPVQTEEQAKAAADAGMAAFAPAREVLKKSGFALPWTRVNNCTQEETAAMPEWMENVPPAPCDVEEIPPDHWMEDRNIPDLPDWMNEAPPMPTEAGDMPPVPEWMYEREQWFDV